MTVIVKWLRNIEHLANATYLLGASVYDDDLDLKEFFERSAEEEAWHYHAMGSASEFLKTDHGQSSPI